MQLLFFLRLYVLKTWVIMVPFRTNKAVNLVKVEITKPVEPITKLDKVNQEANLLISLKVITSLPLLSIDKWIWLRKFTIKTSTCNMLLPVNKWCLQTVFGDEWMVVQTTVKPNKLILSEKWIQKQEKLSKVLKGKGKRQLMWELALPVEVLTSQT